MAPFEDVKIFEKNTDLLEESEEEKKEEDEIETLTETIGT